MNPSEIDALVFDVFGTVVDWRSGVSRAGQSLGRRHDMSIDWAAFADDWRDEYIPALNRVRRGDIPWQNLDALHRNSLDDLLEQYGIEELPEEDVRDLNRAWHRLDPWPDAIPGLLRLKPEYMIAPLSNGHVRLLTNMAKRAGIPWDLILSAELAGHYKPDEEVYLTAVDYLDCEPAQVMMVAAHEGDLDASREAGLRTAFVHRPDERGVDEPSEQPAANTYDIICEDFLALADHLDAPPLG